MRDYQLQELRAEPDLGFIPCRQHNCPVCDHLEFKDRIISEITCSSTGDPPPLYWRDQQVVEREVARSQRNRDPAIPGDHHCTSRTSFQTIKPFSVRPTNFAVGKNMNMNRKVRESFFINKFNSVVDGLNIKCKLQC